MGLKKYNQKRNFRKTIEPKGKTKRTSNALEFVVQQHDASHLHYDFRLEMEGVLKSWAVPKGPSMNPADKRLAMMVEDHPYEYKDFEGTIEEGNYGAGNVIVWDHGLYHAAGKKEPSENEKELLKGIKKGHLSFVLEGKKLKGEFSLVKMKGSQDRAWLLIKKDDKFASEKDILNKNKSVVTGQKLAARKKIQKKPSVNRKISRLPENEKPKKRSGKTSFVKPMAAELASAPFDDDEWIFEMKYDGYRALAIIDGRGNADLYSRNLLSFNLAFPDIAEELEKITHAALLDGEVVAEDEKGRSHFQLLQNYRRTGSGTLKYYVFDLLALDNNDTTRLPLFQRKELLQTLLNNYAFTNIFYSDHIVGKGKKFFDAAIKNKLEGILAKRSQSIYQPGKRSSDWQKIKINKQQEAVIAGITAPKGSRNHIGSLLLGAYEKGELQYIGHCGTGFNESALKDLVQKMKPYFTTRSPFGSKKIKTNGPVKWLKPKLVCEVKFSEWTADGSMRHPVYLGLRMDKEAREVKKEISVPHKKETAAMKEKKGPVQKELKVGKVTLKLTNQDKIYFPGENISKGDLVNYYDEISSVILPYLKNRPESLHRFPNGIQQEGFFQKDLDTKTIPSWVKTRKVYSESNKKNIDYLVCNDKATLMYMANLGCIELNPWNSTILNLHQPDWMVIDLDPEKISFREVVNAALEVKKVLEELDIICYCKTSGATGLHVYVPLGARYDYDIVKQFAMLVAQLTHERLPDTTSVLRMPAKRQGKVYLDFLQNRRGQTLAAPYSIRPRPGAPVSAPLEWKEVNAKLDPGQFTMKTILKRLEKKGDLWKPVIGKGVNLKKALSAVKETNS